MLNWLKNRRKIDGKSSKSGAVVSLSQLGQAKWTPRRYDHLAEAGYRRNVVAFRCIREIAQSASSVPWVLYQGKGEARRELSDHPLLDLLARPNPSMGMAQLIESLLSYYQISGNAYLEAVRSESDAPPQELWVLRPDRIKIIAGEAGLPLAYEYSAGGRAVRWTADPITGACDVLHLKAFHPTDDWYGQGPLEAALLSIDQHNEASNWNQALLQNAARPSGALVYAPQDGPAWLSEDQFNRLRHELETQIEGASNAGRPLLLEGGLDWKSMSLSPADMDWREGRDAVARDIALAFGVPAQLIGFPDAQTYANLREARLAFYEDTIIPLLYSLRDALNGWLCPLFEPDLFLDLDLDQVPALAPRRDALWARIADAHFLSDDEKRAALGYTLGG